MAAALEEIKPQMRLTKTEEIEARQTEKKPTGFRGVLAVRNFRLLWIGEGISLLGDQFYMIALPWLVLQLTGSALAMGTVLAMAGIPRALFMLLGGAITDRFSPKAVMIWSNTVRMSFVALLAALVLTGSIELWMLYALALVFGLADAFFFPAQTTIVPELVKKDDLQAANSIIQGTGQLSLFLGPVLAGAMIAILDGGGSTIAGTAVPDMSGIGAAFAIDALSFVASITCLMSMRIKRSGEAQEQSKQQSGVLSSIGECLSYVWKDSSFRIWFIFIAAINLLATGPFSVGIPVLAHDRFVEGAAAFGIVMSAYGAGSLVGIISAGALPKLPSDRLGKVLMLVSLSVGIGVVLMGLVGNLYLLALVAMAVGTSNGYIVIQFVTWLQSNTPEAMLGRVMGLLMFAVVGLSPVSNAIAGAAITLSETGLFVVAGSLMTALCVGALLMPSVRNFGKVQDEMEKAA